MCFLLKEIFDDDRNMFTYIDRFLVSDRNFTTPHVENSRLLSYYYSKSQAFYQSWKAHYHLNGKKGILFALKPH